MAVTDSVAYHCRATAEPGASSHSSPQCKTTSNLSERVACSRRRRANQAKGPTLIRRIVPSATRDVQSRFDERWERCGLAPQRRRGRASLFQFTQLERSTIGEGCHVESAAHECFSHRGVSRVLTLQKNTILKRRIGLHCPRQWLRCLAFVITVSLMHVFVDEAAAGNGTHTGQEQKSSADGMKVAMSKQRELLFASPLYVNAVTFVASRVEAALQAGNLETTAPAVAAEAAAEISWGECSRLCNGGTQLADTEGARELAMAGIRRAFSERPGWLERYAQEAGERAEKLGIDTATKTIKTRQCNTFRCPPEVPADMKAAELQAARDPTSVAAIGVVPQVEFSQACEEQLKIDEINNEQWERRRKEHLERVGDQKELGKDKGWEATVLAPPSLSLYSCVSLCRLHRRCGAVLYADSSHYISTERQEFSTDTTAHPVDTLKSSLHSANSAISSFQGGNNEVRSFGSPVGSSESQASRGRRIVCSFYEKIKPSHVRECGEEPRSNDKLQSFSLLVLNPFLDFAETARVMRITMALVRERHRDVLTESAELARVYISKWKSKDMSKATRKQERARQLAAKIAKERESGFKTIHVLSEAVRVMEDAAVEAARVINTVQPKERSRMQFPLTSKLPTVQAEREPLSVNDLYSFGSAQPLSESCPMFQGVDLLGRGCVQPPTLKRVMTPRDTSEHPDGNDMKTEKPARATWHRCHDVLEKSQLLLAQYRRAVSQVKAKGAGAENAAEEAEGLARQLLDLGPVEAAELATAKSPTTPTSEEAAPVEDKVHTAFEREVEELRSRRSALEQLGEGSGTIFAAFDTVLEACEIRAIFEPRVVNTGSLGSQFPFACGLFQPSSLLLLSGEGSAATNGELEEVSQEKGVCPEIPCLYSAWTSWSPCTDPDGKTADTGDDAAVKNKGSHAGNKHGDHHRTAIWQIRIKETLLHPAAAGQCEAPVEVRLCKKEAPATSEGLDFMKSFTNAILRSVSSHCEHSPYQPWSQCEPQCIPDHAEGIRPFRTRTRYVQQYPVPGVAPSCSSEILEMMEVCKGLPKCPPKQPESDGATSGGVYGSSPGVATATLASAAAIHLHSDLAPQESNTMNVIPQESSAEAKRHIFPRVRANNGSQDSLSRNREQNSGNETDVPAGTSAGDHTPPPAHLSKTPPSTYKPDDFNDSLHYTGQGDSTLGHGYQRKTRSDVLAPGAFLKLHPSVYSPDKFDDALQHPGEGNESGSTEVIPITFQENGNGASALVQGSPRSLPFDSPAAEVTTPKAGDNTKKQETNDSTKEAEAGAELATSPQDNSAESTKPEEFIFGLSFASFLACCLCGVFASATLVLLSVVCSGAVRSWLGYDWSRARGEENKALLDKSGDLVFPARIGSNGAQVLTPQGPSSLAYPCMTASGVQHVTPGGSLIFVTTAGEFVDNRGKPVGISQLPAELQNRAGATVPKDQAASVSLVVPPPGKTPPIGAPPTAAVTPSHPPPRRPPIAKAAGAGGGLILAAKAPGAPPAKTGATYPSLTSKQPAVPKPPQSKAGGTPAATPHPGVK